jgi:hypothetical protein
MSAVGPSDRPVQGGSNGSCGSIGDAGGAIAWRRAAKRGGPTRQFDLVLEASNAGGGIDEVPGGHWKQGSGMGVKSNARRSLTSKSGRTSLYNHE